MLIYRKDKSVTGGTHMDKSLTFPLWLSYLIYSSKSRSGMKAKNRPTIHNYIFCTWSRHDRQLHSCIYGEKVRTIYIYIYIRYKYSILHSEICLNRITKYVAHTPTSYSSIPSHIPKQEFLTSHITHKLCLSPFGKSEFCGSA